MAERRVTPSAGARRDVDRLGLRVVRFEYLSSQHAPGLVGLCVQTPVAWPDAARPSLIAQRGTHKRLYPPRLVSRYRSPHRDSGDWLWRALFATPPELASDAGWIFQLRLNDDVVFPLPTPVDRLERLRGPADHAAPRRTWPYAVRRGALAFIVTCQLSLAFAWPAAVASAETPSIPPSSDEPTGESPPSPPATTPIEPVQEGVPSSPAGGPSEGATEDAPQQGPEASPEAPTPPDTGPAPEATTGAPQPPSASVGPATAAASSASDASDGPGQAGSSSHAGTRPRRVARPGDPQGAADNRGRDAHARHARGRHHPAQRNSNKAAHGRAGSREHRYPDAGGAAAHVLASGPSVVSPGPFEVPSALLQLPVGSRALRENDPPALLIPIYEDAAHRYEVPWRVLAAINQIETDYGRNLSVSPAGAVGWMQFMPETWAQWGVDADHDGQANPYSPMDAIFTAARYLQASGASRDLPSAIFAYNHAASYVVEVLLRAHALEHDPTSPGSLKGYALPLDKPYMEQLGRTDDGVDIETPPDGALVYSITPGIVTAVASDPGGFGPNYPVIEATAGSLAGQHVYYGHVAQALVRPGQRVAPGQPIAIVGHTGDAASLGHGHIEIGFSDAGGDPLSHHGATASTPTGELMRSVLVELSAELDVHNS